MSEVAANTPVIVGVGFCQVKSSDPLDCPEPIQLMFNAVRDAADNAGASDLLAMVDSIAVQQGSWQYKNPGKMIADEIGSPNATSILSDLGVLQIMPFFELCESIKDGRQQVGVVTGGEARFRELRSMITAVPVDVTEEPEGTPPPDVYYEIPDEFSSKLEEARGIWAPGEFYALAESAIRYHSGLSLEEHSDKIAKLYSGFSEVAKNNPHAWKQESLSAEQIKTVTDKNAMIAFPYTKAMMSQWNVNQSVAIIVCSAGKAKELGLDNSSWIYPLSAVQSRKVINLSQQKTLHTHPGIVLTGKRALELAGVTTKDVGVADLYSCFPSSIQASIADLKLESDCPVNVTGSMAYAGGPFNHAALDSVARMVEVLREAKQDNNDEKKIGMVTNLSGMFGKQGCGLLSNQPGEIDFSFDDVTDIIAEQNKAVPLDPDYTGPAVIVAYTVAYNKADISHAIAYCDTPKGERTVVRSEDKALCQKMTEQEFVGHNIMVNSDGSFTAK